MKKWRAKTICPARFHYFQWPCGQADPWVRLPARAFLSAFYSNHGPPKGTVFTFELGAWNRHTGGWIDHSSA